MSKQDTALERLIKRYGDDPARAERDELVDAATAFEKLCCAYRIQQRPSEKLLDQVAKARVVLLKHAESTP